MSSDEDASFPFTCEGSSAVLGIFGESTGVLPDMSTSSAVTDLEDVFAKASLPDQTTALQSDTQPKIAQNPVADVLSDFQVESADVTATEESRKGLRVDNPSLLGASVDLTTAEIQQVLIQEASSGLTAESSILDTGVETDKNPQENTSANVAGSVELAEEIMEAFANSKAVLDSENPGASNIQEELERLEQLAVERVREIEGDLVNSTRQITDSLSNNTEINSDMQETFTVETVVSDSNMVVPNVTHVPNKEADENKEQLDVASADIPATTSEVAAVESSVQGVMLVGKEESKELKTNVENTGSLKDEITQDNTSNIVKTSKSSESVQEHSQIEDKTVTMVTETETKENTQKEVTKKDNNVELKYSRKVHTSKESHRVNKSEECKNDGNNKIEGKKHKSGKTSSIGGPIGETTSDVACQKLTGKKSSTAGTDSSSVAKSFISGKNRIKEKDASSSGAEIASFVKDTDSENKIKDTSSAESSRSVKYDSNGKSKIKSVGAENVHVKGTNSKKKMKDVLPKGAETESLVNNSNNENKITDLQNYETEDDDLSVLEAFIEKSATNPEIAVCTVPDKKDYCQLKDSESSLIDVLSKCDNVSSPIEGESAEGDVIKYKSTPTDSQSDSGTSKGTPSQALDNASQKKDSNSNIHPKVREGDIGHQSFTVKSPKFIDAQLPLKKRIAQMPIVTEKQQSVTEKQLSSVPVDTEKQLSSLPVDTEKQLSSLLIDTEKQLSQKSIVLMKLGLQTTSSSKAVDSGLVNTNVNLSEKKIVTVEVRKRRGRPPGVFRKSFVEKSLVDLKKKSVEETVAEKSNSTKTDGERVRKSLAENNSVDLKNKDDVDKSRAEKSIASDNKLVQKAIASDNKLVQKAIVSEKSGSSKKSSEKSDSSKTSAPETPISSKATTAGKSNYSKGTDKAKPVAAETLPTSRKSMRSLPKKITETEENVQSSGEVVYIKVVKKQSSQQSGDTKGQKKLADDTIQNITSTSKTLSNSKEGKLKLTSPSTSGTEKVTMKEHSSKTSLSSKERKLEKNSPTETVNVINNEKRMRKDNLEQSLKVRTNVEEKLLHSVSDQETSNNEGNVQISSSAVTAGKKNERKDTVTPVKKITSSDGSENAETEAQSRATRSQKHAISAKRPQSLKQTEKKGNDKENLDESTRSLTDNRSVKKEKEETLPSHTPGTAECTNHEKSREENGLDSEFQRAKSIKRRIAEENPPFAPATLKRSRVEREIEILLDSDKDCSQELQSGSANPSKSPCFIDLDTYNFKDEEITFDVLKNNAKQLILPSSLWGVQVSKENDLVAFSRLNAEQPESLKIDKALVFQGTLKPIALIKNEPIDIPIPTIRTFEDVVMLIRNFHFVSFCEGTGVTQKPLSKNCYRYLDIANPGQRCSQCLEERRRSLMLLARKMRERVELLRTRKGLQ